MMKKKLSGCFLLLVLTTLIYSCESVNKSTEQAEIFYEALKNKNFDGALAICSEKAFKNEGKEAWKAMLTNKANNAGELTSYSKNGFKVQTKNGETTARLNYSVTYEKASFKEELIFLKEEDTYKLIGYNYNKK